MRLTSCSLIAVLAFAGCEAEDHGARHAPAAKPAAVAPAPAPAVAAAPAAHAPAAHPAAGQGEPAAQGLDAQQALTRLMEGNKRFVDDVMNKGHKDAERRSEVATGQHPIAIVVCCSDSRVPPEQVFDVGLGDIFVVRVAGNVLDDVGMGSIEYAAAHLHVPLVVVLGHERCGAVTAAISGEAPPAHVLSIVDHIQRNIGDTAPAPGDPVDQAVRLNAKAVASQVAGSAPILKEMVEQGALQVIALRYDLDDGVVEALP